MKDAIKVIVVIVSGGVLIQICVAAITAIPFFIKVKKGHDTTSK